MPIIGIAQLLIEPSTAGLQQRVSRDVGRSMPRVGREAGQSLGRGMADGFAEQSASLEADVNQLAGKVGKAEADLAKARERRGKSQADEAKALGDLRIAELKLEEIRDGGAAKASQIAVAEQKLAGAREKVAASAAKREAAESKLTAAQERERTALGAIAAAEEKVAGLREKAQPATDRIAAAEQKLADLRAKANPNAEKIAAAEERLEGIRQRAQPAADRITAAEEKLTSLRGKAEAATKQRETAERALASSSAAAEKAAADVHVAELKLRETRESSGAKASQIAEAEQRVAVARAKASDATRQQESATQNLSRQTIALSNAQSESSRAVTELETHLRRVNTESESTERGFGRLGTRMRTMFQGSPLAGVADLMRRDTDRVSMNFHAMADDVSKAGTRGGKGFVQGFTGIVGGLSAVMPAAGGAGAALLGASGNALTLGASLGSLAGVSALIPAGLMAIGGGAGVMAAAFAGVGTALKAVTDQQDAVVANPKIAAMALQDAAQAITVAEENAAQARVDSARRVADAKRSLSDTVAQVAQAEKAAADSIVQATRRVADAKRSLADAVKAAAEAEEASADAVESANRRVRDARQALVDVAERAAESQKSAAKAVVDAQRNEVKAAQDVVKAQEALVEARKKAADLAASLAKKSQTADFKAIDTALALKKAHEELEAAKANPASSATLIAQLENNAAKALARDEAAKKSVKDLAAERVKVEADAAKGSGSVADAEQRLTDARQSQADALESRKDAEAKVGKQAKDSARAMADAQESVADALKGQKDAREDVTKSAEDSARRILDAQLGVTDAIDGEKDARADAVKAGVDGARQIADAQQGVTDAVDASKRSQIDSARAVKSAQQGLERVQMQQADAAKAAGKAVADAMADLTPSAVLAVGALLKVKDQLGGIRRIAQENFFKGFASPLLSLAGTVMPQLATGVGAIATALGAGAQTTMNSLNDALGDGVLAGLLRGVAKSITVANTAIDPLIKSFVTLGVVGMDYMPRFTGWIADMATSFNNFVQDAASSGALNTWIEDGITAFKDLGSVVGSVSGIFGSLTRAAETGGASSSLAGLASGLRDIDSAMQGSTFQTTMSTIFAGAEAGSQGLLKGLKAIGQAFVDGAPAFADFLKLGGEISGTFVGGVFKALSNPAFGAGLTTFLEGIKGGVENVVPLLPGLTSGFGKILTTMAPIVEKLGPTLVKVFTTWGEIIGTLLDTLKPLLVAIAGSPAILGGLIVAFGATALATKGLTLAGNIQKIAMAGWRVVKLLGAVAMGVASVAQGVFAAAMGRGSRSIIGNKLAIIGYRVAMMAGAAATGIATAAQKLFNGALRANPIGLIITAVAALVAGLVWFFTQTKLGKDIVKNVWAGIQAAVKFAWEQVIQPAFKAIVGFVQNTLVPIFQWLYENIIKPIFKGIATYVAIQIAIVVAIIKGLVWVWKNVLAPAITWVWENVLKPVFKALGDFFGWVWNSVLKPAFNAVVTAFKAVGAALKLAWDTVLKPVFKALGDFFKTMWDTVLKVAFDAVKWYFSNLATGMKIIWRDVLKPVFKALGDFFKLTWDTVLKPAFDAVKSAFGVVGSKLSSIWNDTIKPVFTALGNFFKSVWNDVLSPAFGWVKSGFAAIGDKIGSIWNDNIKPIFSALGSFVKDSVAPAFQKGIDAVKAIWSKLQDIAKRPVKFMIEQVINKGLIGAFNGVAKFIDPGGKLIKPLAEVALPKGFARGGWTGPGSKYQEAGIVHADEFVVRKESQRSIERSAPGFLDGLNNLGAKALGYAKGGLVRPVKSGIKTSGFGANRGKYTHMGTDYAVPTGTPVFAAMDGTVQNAGWKAVGGRTGIGAFLGHEGNRNTYYGHLSQLMVKVGDMVKAGQQIALSGNTGRSTGPHLHFETWTGGRPVNAEPFLNGATLPSGGSSGGGLLGGLDPLSGLTDLVSGLGDKFKSAFPGGGHLVDTAMGVGGKLIGDVKDWIGGKIASIGDVGKEIAGTAKAGISAMTEGLRWSGVGTAALARTGDWGPIKGPANLGYMLARMKVESGFNPKAINNWDSNARRGTPSKGLMQVIDPTFAAYRDKGLGNDIWDPLQNIVASINYTKSRYGSLKDGWAGSKGYADGGLVTDQNPARAILRDSGGELPRGLSMILNARPESEWILNKPQIDQMEMNWERRGAGGRGGNVSISVVAPEQATAGEFFRMAKHEVAVMNRRGGR